MLCRRGVPSHGVDAGGEEPDEDEDPRDGEDPPAGAFPGDELVEGRIGDGPWGEGHRVGLEGREDRGPAGGLFQLVAAERGAVGGDLVELAGGEGEPEGLVLIFEGGEVFLMPLDPRQAVGFKDPGAIAEPAGFAEVVNGGDEHGGGQEGEPGDEEKPPRVEGDGLLCRCRGPSESRTWMRCRRSHCRLTVSVRALSGAHKSIFIPDSRPAGPGSPGGRTSIPFG
jgi:hypothetical protein